ALRVEQFVELQPALLLVSGGPETLRERLVQRTALFLGVAGAAVGVLQDGLYTVLATYGLGPEYRARYDRQSLRESALAPALGGGRPLVLDDADRGASVRSLVLPFRGPDLSGALHLVVAGTAPLAHPGLELACALGELLATLQTRTSALATRAGRLTCRVPPGLPPLRTDRVKVKEIVQNLVYNALKHSDGRAVEIEVALAPEREAVRLTVRDRG